MGENEQMRAIESLLRFDSPIGDCVRDLNRISGELKEDLVILKASHIRSVLNRFLVGEISAQDVENWADAIEMREGIAAAPGPVDLRQLIFELANPQINAEITPTTAKQFLAILGFD